MAVFRIEKTRNYTVMSNHHLRNAGLSLKELERAGYIVRNRLRDSKGKILDVEYVIYETPHPPRHRTVM